MKRFRLWVVSGILLSIGLACAQSTPVPSAAPLEIKVTNTPKAVVREGPTPAPTVTQIPPTAIPTQASRPVLACPEQQKFLLQTPKMVQPVQPPKPQARTPWREPLFDTCLVRVSDQAVDLIEAEKQAGLRTDNAQIQSFNADGTYLLLRSTLDSWYLYDAVTLKRLKRVPLGFEPRWDPSAPNLLYFFDETRLIRYDVSLGQPEQMHDFKSDFPDKVINTIGTHNGGGISKDGRYWGLMLQDQDWKTFSLIVFDLKQNIIVSRRDLLDRPSISSARISPLGGYFIVNFDQYCERNQPGSDLRPCGVMVYDHNIKNGRSLLRIFSPSDLALDEQGQEVLVYQDGENSQIAMLELESGKITPLLDISFSNNELGYNFSGLAYQKPGWVVISTLNGKQPHESWLDDSIIMLELKQGGGFIRLAYTYLLPHPDENTYLEPAASPDLDLNRIVFNSNWNALQAKDQEVYLIQLPPNWDKLPAK